VLKDGLDGTDGGGQFGLIRAQDPRLQTRDLFDLDLTRLQRNERECGMDQGAEAGTRGTPRLDGELDQFHVPRFQAAVLQEPVVASRGAGVVVFVARMKIVPRSIRHAAPGGRFSRHLGDRACHKRGTRAVLDRALASGLPGLIAIQVRANRLRIHILADQVLIAQTFRLFGRRR